jgi:3-oxoadipate enol-lactonase/4-carboxymuconolactone decarboxylase
MPFVTHADARLFWRQDGDPAKPPLLLLNSIGTDHASWDRTLPFLLPHARLIRMDTRGHGASDAPPGEYSLDLLAADAESVLDAAGLESAAICGVSLGGMIAMTMALRAPRRVRALVAACTSPRMEAEAWVARIEMVRSGGTAAIVEAALGRFFTKPFASLRPDLTGGIRAGLLGMSAAGYAACGAALRDMDLRPQLGSIDVPTLVVAGERDVSTPYETHGKLIADGVPGARLAMLDAPHLAQVETPAAFSAAVLGFLRTLQAGPEQNGTEDPAYTAGLQARRQVLGDDWVDRALAARTLFNSDFQAMITRIAWHEIWNRPGLDHRTRRLLVLAITAALGRWEEFALHARTGLKRKGFEETELRETLMQLAIYAGVPAANTAFAESARILREVSEGQS